MSKRTDVFLKDKELNELLPGLTVEETRVGCSISPPGREAYRFDIKADFELPTYHHAHGTATRKEFVHRFYSELFPGCCAGRVVSHTFAEISHLIEKDESKDLLLRTRLLYLKRILCSLEGETMVFGTNREDGGKYCSSIKYEITLRAAKAAGYEIVSKFVGPYGNNLFLFAAPTIRTS